MNYRKIGIDTRELEHPEPLEMAMKILQTLEEDNYLYMLHRKKPLPLIDLALENNYQVLTQEDTKKEWHILISKNKDIPLDTFINV